MKVSLITRHAVLNYGSLLQAYALQKNIEELGYECEIINYIREDEHYRNIDKTLLSQKPEWNNSFLRRSLYLALRKPVSIIAGKKFEAMQKAFLNLSKRYRLLEDLRQYPNDSDVYMTGSDQVWGAVANEEYDEAYYLSFLSDNNKKVSYASSFGKAKLSDNAEKKITELLKEYEKITVREDSAKEYLDNLGLDSAQVLDPTLLIDSKSWSKLIRKKPENKYILIYQLHNDQRINDYAKWLSSKTGLKVIRISIHLHQITRIGKLKWLPDVSEVLALIKYADYFITDSFHATAFAINFNTPFVEVLPGNKTEKRNISLLKLTGLENRILNDDNYETGLEKIDFSYANKVLEKERIRSKEILKEMIK